MILIVNPLFLYAMGKVKWFLLVVFILGCPKGYAQQINMNTIPADVQKACIDTNGDTIAVVHLRDVYVYPEIRFRNKKEQEKYTKLIRDVKRTLPYAQLIYDTLIETYEYMETLPDQKAKERHLKQMEKDLFKQYKPELRKLTFSQGKLLIKLIDRECNQSSYHILKAYLGSFRAGFWNLFAGMFGVSLKSGYDPKGADAMTERIVVLVENGLI